MDKKVDNVFISYRRKTSKYPSLLVYKDLSLNNYDVFIDYERLDSGKFATEILNQIAARSHFVVILSPGCLDRTVNPDDWLRKEIEYAMDMERNIVPLLFDGFAFENAKQFLTGKLSALKDYNGIQIPDGYFDEAMNKLRNRFLKQPVKGVVQPAPASDGTFVLQTLQKANTAIEKESITDGFIKYVNTVSKIYTDTRRLNDMLLSYREPRLPARKDVLGRDPIQGEIILLNTSVEFPREKTGVLQLSRPHKGSIIITDKRLIIRDLDNDHQSFEISRATLSYARITYQPFLDSSFKPATQLTIKLSEKKYTFWIDNDIKSQMKSIIGGDSLLLSFIKASK